MKKRVVLVVFFLLFARLAQADTVSPAKEISLAKFQAISSTLDRLSTNPQESLPIRQEKLIQEARETKKVEVTKEADKAAEKTSEAREGEVKKVEKIPVIVDADEIDFELRQTVGHGHKA